MRQFIGHYSNMKQLWWNKDKIPLRTTPINFHLYLPGNIKQCLAEWVWVIKWRIKRHKLQTYGWDFVMTSGRVNKMCHQYWEQVCLLDKNKEKVTPSTQNRNLLVPGQNGAQTCYPIEEFYRKLCSSVYAAQGKLQGTCLDFLLLSEDIKCHERHTLHQKLNFFFCLRVLHFLSDANSLSITFQPLPSTSVLPL